MKPMNPSYGRKRGDLTSAKYIGRVDVYHDGQVEHDHWGRASTRRETYWTAPGDGDATALATEIAERIGGEVRADYYDPHTRYRWRAHDQAQIIVVPPAP